MLAGRAESPRKGVETVGTGKSNFKELVRRKKLLITSPLKDGSQQCDSN
jgi:hypothetical protein